MVVNFNGYQRIIDDGDNNIYESNQKPDLKFDNDYFQGLVSNREFDEAINYANQFRFNDVEQQQKFENHIYNIAREGRKISAYYGNIGNTDDLNKIEFRDNIFNNYHNENNPFYQKFIDYKDGLLNSSIEKHNYETISLDFEPEKQYVNILGFNIDWIAPDNIDNNIDAFYKKSGISEAKLKSVGIIPKKKDGHTILEFDKNHPLANQLLYNVDTRSPFIHVTGKDVDGNTIQTLSEPKVNIERMQNIIDDAERTKKAYLSNKGAVNSNLYSSTIFPLINDNLNDLNNQLHTGLISESEYNKRVTRIESEVMGLLKAGSFHNMRIYSNEYNKNPLDNTLVEIGNEQRTALSTMLSSINPKDIELNGMISGGQLGVLVTINATPIDNKNLKQDISPEDRVKTKKTQIFIPGFMTDKVQASVNRNTSTRAIQEVNNMIDFNYSYKLSDGREVFADREGNFYSNGQHLDKNTVIREIDKSMIIDDAKRNLKFKFTNAYHDVYDRDGFDNAAKMIAVNAVNSLYPNVSFLDDSGNRLNFAGSQQDVLAAVDFLFSKKGMGNDVIEEYKRNIPWDLAKKFQQLYDIYNQIYSSLDNKN